MSSAVSAIIDSLESLDTTSLSDQDRLRLTNHLLTTRRRIQSPFEIALDHVWAELAEVAAIKTLIDARVFTYWTKSGKKVQSSRELAEHCNADPNLIYRLISYLASRGHFTRSGLDEFELTSFTRNLSNIDFSDLYTAYYEIQNPGFSAFPTHAKEVLKYHNHINSKQKVWSTVMNKEGATIFDYVTATPIRNRSFNIMMLNWLSDQKSWTEMYAVEEKLMQDYKGDTPLVVDIGGNNGADLKRLSKILPSLPKGSLILQDLEAVIEDAKSGVLPESIEAQAIDIFRSEPVHNARAYFMHSVLHDWSDSDALLILAKIKEAMTDASIKRDYVPKLLIHEIVLGEPPLPFASLLDTIMLMHTSAAERTKAQWESLLKQAGFIIEAFHTLPDCASSVIECHVSDRKS